VKVKVYRQQEEIKHTGMLHYKLNKAQHSPSSGAQEVQERLHRQSTIRLHDTVFNEVQGQLYFFFAVRDSWGRKESMPVLGRDQPCRQLRVGATVKETVA
jgi:hypothetical protein